MRTSAGPAILVRIFVGESKKHHHAPLWSALLERFHAEGVAGVTVLRGIAGYGHTSVVHTSHLVDLAADLPMVLEVIDVEEKLATILSIADEMVPSGLVTLERIEVLRYAKA